jgi:predicted anti-sigma-YlaC factor YlaD
VESPVSRLTFRGSGTSRREMSRPEVSEVCRNARELLSWQLDEPVPEIQRAALRAHLRACPNCDEFSRQLGAITSALRGTPLEQPRAFSVPPARARRVPRHTFRVAVAAAMGIAASAALGAFVERTMQPVPTVVSAPLQVNVKATQEPYVEQHLLARLRRADPPRGRVIAT